MGNQYVQKDGSGHGIFPEPRLRLVDPQRDCLAHRCAVVIGIEALLVEAVADLVQDPEERVAEIVFVEARRDPAIARPDARAERVGGYVQPAALEVKADCRGGRLAEDLLPIARIEAVEDRRPRAPDALDCGCRGGRAVDAGWRSAICRDQGDELTPQRLEDNSQLGAAGPGLVFVEERIVDRSRTRRAVDWLGARLEIDRVLRSAGNRGDRRESRRIPVVSVG